MFGYVLLGVLIIFWLYVHFLDENPRLVYIPTPFNLRVIKASGIGSVRFQPGFWCANGHLQTVATSYLRLSPNMSFRR